MSSTSNDQVRHQILQALYDQAQKKPDIGGIDRKTMVDTLQIPEKQLDFNITYLEEKGLVRLETHIGGGARAS